MLRCDHGTENGSTAVAQIAFRSNGSDSLAGKSVRYGSSPANVVSVQEHVVGSFLI